MVLGVTTFVTSIIGADRAAGVSGLLLAATVAWAGGGHLLPVAAVGALASMGLLVTASGSRRGGRSGIEDASPRTRIVVTSPQADDTD